MIDGAVHVTTLDRDGAGRIVRQDVDGEVTEFTYGPAGELVARFGAGGDARWEYDVLGRLRLETTPSSSAGSATTVPTSSSSWSRRRRC